MQKEYFKFFLGILLITFVGTMLSCATDRLPLATQNSLSQNELAYYSDDFDEMREDLWDRAGYLYRQEQVHKFKQADMRIDNGKLVLRTKTGSFSKAGLASKYALRGDFDIELDCRMDFIKGISIWDMDQLFSFAVFDKSVKAGKINFAVIGLLMEGGSGQGYIYCNCAVNGKRKKGRMHMVEDFNGLLRILRKGKQLSLLYKMMGATEWTPMNTFQVTGDDMRIGFQFRNFFNNRATIRAKDSISIEVDRFKINAARQIIEEEI